MSQNKPQNRVGKPHNRRSDAKFKRWVSYMDTSRDGRRGAKNGYVRDTIEHGEHDARKCVDMRPPVLKMFSASDLSLYLSLGAKLLIDDTKLIRRVIFNGKEIASFNEREFAKLKDKIELVSTSIPGGYAVEYIASEASL